MSKTLFICLGNVDRSQMAEAFYNHFTRSSDASSAGLIQKTPKLYPRLPDDICNVMAEQGIDVSNQKVKTVNEDMVNAAERIFVMCEKEHCPDYLLKSSKAVFWQVEDPYKKSFDELRSIRDEIKAKVKSVI